MTIVIRETLGRRSDGHSLNTLLVVNNLLCVIFPIVILTRRKTKFPLHIVYSKRKRERKWFLNKNSDEKREGLFWASKSVSLLPVDGARSEKDSSDFTKRSVSNMTDDVKWLWRSPICIHPSIHT